MPPKICGKWKRRSLATLAVIMLGAAGLPTLASAQDASQAQDTRLATIGYRLSVANVDLCDQRAMRTGLLLHDIGSYERRRRAAVISAYGLGQGFGILDIVADSAAARAGLRVRDEIVSVNGMAMESFATNLIARSARYDRVAAFDAFLAAALAAGPASVAVRRDGQVVTLAVSGEEGCAGQFVVVPSRALNAWSDGKSAAVTTKLMNFATDDNELAFVVAHEMSHNILQHQARLGGDRSGLFGPLEPRAARVKKTEVEADGFAIRLMTQAGYSTNGAEAFLRRSRRAMPINLSMDHPGIGRRIETVQAAIWMVEGTALALASGEPAAMPSSVLTQPALALPQLVLAEATASGLPRAGAQPRAVLSPPVGSYRFAAISVPQGGASDSSGSWLASAGAGMDLTVKLNRLVDVRRFYDRSMPGITREDVGVRYDPVVGHTRLSGVLPDSSVIGPLGMPPVPAVPS